MTSSTSESKIGSKTSSLSNPPARTALEVCLRLLAIRPRSVKEITDSLKKKGVSPETIQQTIEKLKQTRLLGDDAFAKWLVESRSRRRPSGRLRLEQELKRKGINEEQAKGMLAIDYQSLATGEAERLNQKLSYIPSPGRSQRIAARLRRRGFTWEQIRKALESIEAR